MNVKNSESLHYELGVLMFNTVSGHDKSLIINNDYDGTGNFVGIIEAIGLEDLTPLKEGFIAECQNYDINKEEAEKYFNDCLENISNY